MSTNQLIESLEPVAVWRFFAGIAAVPRPSKHEEKIREHIKALAKQHNLTCREEAVGNLIIDVPATPDHESAAVTVLQAHLDMVCEKNSGTEHDFDKQGITLILEKDADGEQIVRADETTLGADNGIGVAMALAAATSAKIVHGPLELLFTIDEEAGMTGAKALTPDSIRGKRLLNLDSEEDDRIYIGCAGGCDSTLTWTFTPEPIVQDSQCCEVVISGLRGGHSGADIHEGRGSAIKWLARTLAAAGLEKLRLCDIQGGSKRNAIPRESRAVVVGGADLCDALTEAARRVCEEAHTESLETKATIDVRTLDGQTVGSVLSIEATKQVISTLKALPHGVVGLHPSIPGLVETSNNVSTIQTANDGANVVVEIGTLSRSSSASRLRELLDSIEAVADFAGAQLVRANDYPGWQPDPDSKLLATCKGIYSELFGNDPQVAAIHAGLECGIIGERVGQMDMVSFGPRIEGAHSPEERIWVNSVEKSWKYLVAVLAKLA